LEQQWANICLFAANSHQDFLAGSEEILALHKAVMLYFVIDNVK